MHRRGPWAHFLEGEEWQDWLPPGARRLRFGRRVDRGDVKLLILTVLQDGPKHGYEIIKEIEQRSKGAYAPSAGTVYPTLQMLEDMGQVRSTQQEERRVYAITDAGKAYLAEHQVDAGEAWARFEGWDWRSLFGNEDQRQLQRELVDLAGSLFSGGRILRADAQQLGQIREALRQARERIEAVLQATS